ncbi:lysyl oxidase family protein [Archangium violaceum]|uniref:lysyl oxidase family protein n=1 Tax=Archangium violaceum TaxID=83451 RepID=UPI0037C0C0A0
MKLSRLFVSAVFSLQVAGCHTPTPPPEALPPEAPPPEAPPPEGPPPEEQGPFLSDTPLWTLEAPESLRQSCFGSSIALGDVNGDGKQDLVVAAPPCTGMRGKGHLALFAGDGSSFSTQPVIAELDWQNPNPSASGRRSEVSIGDVNGDRFADILVRAQSAGTLVFTGREDLGAVLQAPLFRVPFQGAHYAALFSDLDGNGRDELVVIQGAELSLEIYRATPEGAEPFTRVRRFEDYTLRVSPVGDRNGDGAEDLLVVAGLDSRIYLGCKQEEPGVCEGGLSVSPAWQVDPEVLGFFPDQNGDGHPEMLLGEWGRTRVYLSEADGGISQEPIWSLMGDPAFTGFGAPAFFVGDLNKDGQQTEFLMGAQGRLYAFFPKQGISAELRPDWAWPKSNKVEPGFDGYVRYSPVGAGDLNGDGYADIIAGLAPPYDQLTPGTAQRPGRVVAFGGGKIPSGAPTPILKEASSCGLAREGGKPDVTVDSDVISRTMYVDRRNFSETACEVTERCVGAPGDRRLLRFGVSIQNMGSAAVNIPSPEDRPDLYEFDACHLHDHLIGFASYELLDARSTVVAVGRKQGFFLLDYAPYCGDSGPPHLNEDNSQGISPGWADVYAADYPCQWLDITDVPDGTYTLRVGVDKNNLIDEQDVLPNSVDVKVKLSGNAVEVLP